MPGVRIAIGLVALALATACGAGGGGSNASGPIAPAPITGPNSASVSWVANRETAVNGPGGGYRVYYSRTPGFNIATAEFKEVPYVTGTEAPTSVIVDDLPSGTIYFKVVAYSPLTPPGGSAGSTSQPSAQGSVVLP